MFGLFLSILEQVRFNQDAVKSFAQHPHVDLEKSVRIILIFKDFIHRIIVVEE